MIQQPGAFDVNTFHPTHRPPAVAGRFYSSDPRVLDQQIHSWLYTPMQHYPRLCPKVLVVPHAGYLYSGEVAARAYALLKPFRHQIRRVVLLGPSHSHDFRGIAIPSVDFFETPIGNIPLDRKMLASLLMFPEVVVNDEAHAFEHSLEVQLPFLKSVLDEFLLVPLAVGNAKDARVFEIIEQIWGGHDCLVVVSTDLSHFLSESAAVRRDSETLKRIVKLSPTLHPEDACGAISLNGVLRSAALRGFRAEILAATHSGETTGCKTRVVGYSAVALWPPSAQSSPNQPLNVAENEDARIGEALVILARNAIADRLGIPPLKALRHQRLAAPGAAFVLVYRNGKPQGFAGRLVAGTRALDADVRHHALAAAFEDIRFAPITVDDWEGIAVEVSLLGTPEPLVFDSEASAIRALTPGCEGIIFSYKTHRSMLMPQAWYEIPVARDFLRELKIRAGLPADFWSSAIRLSRYRTRDFRADELSR